ncbi:threonine-phosphate decarboxylase [Bacillus lacus]|uniref:threonine-phosphate decarboxylase n=1 Tax=Metabacillus lacus TaxID=1983721 RepID=A0A7X2IZE3_9BACI|nr:threonine-phosphate decarboxylase CobD [Metabacillus lacus]MRX72506.1 threonine-phosphate decarboxylase [Metabacillus lacus]
MKWPAHGSNPQYVYQAMNLPMPTERMDYSANINPLGPPSVIRERWGELSGLVTEYPDPYGAALKRKLSKALEISERCILIGNGGSELISLLGRLLAGREAAIVQPSFTEYEEACRVNHCAVSYVQAEEGSWRWGEEDILLSIKRSDALFLCNPSNPTGVYYGRKDIVRLLMECRKYDCKLIIDEAFYDFLEEYESLVPLLKEFPQLIIIRSLTKMYAIPGLRLGYLLADEEVVSSLSKLQPHWSVNALALQAGEWCLDCESHVQETQKAVSRERERLFQFYHSLNLLVSPSSTNYYLLRIPGLQDQFQFYEYLVKHGIIPRHSMNFKGIEGRWLRFAIRTEAENDRLMEAVEKWMNTTQ